MICLNRKQAAFLEMQQLMTELNHVSIDGDETKSPHAAKV